MISHKLNMPELTRQWLGEYIIELIFEGKIYKQNNVRKRSLKYFISNEYEPRQNFMYRTRFLVNLTMFLREETPVLYLDECKSINSSLTTIGTVHDWDAAKHIWAPVDSFNRTTHCFMPLAVSPFLTGFSAGEQLL